MRDRLGRYGAWRRASLVTPELAAHLEALGFGTLWLGGSPDGDLRDVDPLLAATSTLTVATGIVNVWRGEPGRTAEAFARVEEAYPGRFLLGIGVGHPENDGRYASPFEALNAYLDALLAGGVPAGRIVLAALGPKVLKLAAERAGGAHPYLVTPEHTRTARAILGPDRILAPEHKVVLDPDPVSGRALARDGAAFYLDLGNYTANLRRLGWADEDLVRPGSDALIDALVAHGDDAAVAGRIAEHFAAGADHVAVQLLLPPDADPFLGYRRLAEALDVSAG